MNSLEVFCLVANEFYLLSKIIPNIEIKSQNSIGTVFVRNFLPLLSVISHILLDFLF